MYAIATIRAHKDEIVLEDARTGNKLDVLPCEGLGNKSYNEVVEICMDLAKVNNRDLVAYKVK
jgi:hypothetical protein